MAKVKKISRFKPPNSAEICPTESRPFFSFTIKISVEMIIRSIKISLAACLLFAAGQVESQPFYFGSDLSYVHEMEDCGVVFKDENEPKDVHEIFASHGTNLVRLRLWHTPAWLDTLNAGKRYSDFADVRKSILRAKAAGMAVLLDFHLSDLWADPSRQILPTAWSAVVDNLPALSDSVFNHIFSTLSLLDSEGLLPEMVQIGNETNRGILLSEAQNNAGWVLNWPRNAALFKRAIQAVRAVETASGKPIKVAIHIAGPADAGWLMKGFWDNGVKDFDIIGLSYYWAWHKPTTIAQTGDIITALKTAYAGKAVMIFETGYIWTTQNIDGATNIISETHPDYAPASPENQKKWLTDLTQKVIDKGGAGVIYWEPAWQSSPCFTPWGQGSHQEHATFFNFQNNVLPAGGMSWPEFNFQGLPSPVESPEPDENAALIQVLFSPDSNLTRLELNNFSAGKWTLQLFSLDGKLIQKTQRELTGDNPAIIEWTIGQHSEGLYILNVFSERGAVVRKVWVN